MYQDMFHPGPPASRKPPISLGIPSSCESRSPLGKHDDCQAAYQKVGISGKNQSKKMANAQPKDQYPEYLHGTIAVNNM